MRPPFQGSGRCLRTDARHTAAAGPARTDTDEHGRTGLRKMLEGFLLRSELRRTGASLGSGLGSTDWLPKPCESVAHTRHSLREKQSRPTICWIAGAGACAWTLFWERGGGCANWRFGFRGRWARSRCCARGRARSAAKVLAHGHQGGRGWKTTRNHPQSPATTRGCFIFWVFGRVLVHGHCFGNGEAAVLIGGLVFAGVGRGRVAAPGDGRAPLQRCLRTGFRTRMFAHGQQEDKDNDMY
ncbi:MAG: hypothetical protein JWR26_5036 [Pedosphaera sp.]|nr:hypothetical protein [Pedosphaera sp.]